MKYTDIDMISFANFLRDNFYVTGAPNLASYNTQKYPSSSIEEIFTFWKQSKKDTE